jgi:hypothetical protein
VIVLVGRVRDEVRGRIMQRRLAGDSRAGQWARGEAARREAAFLRRVWKPLTGLVLVAAAAIVGIAFIVPSGFLRGLVVGVLGTAVIAMICIMTMPPA